MLKIQISEHEQVKVVQPQGRLDTVSSTDFSAEMNRLINIENTVIIDASECTYLSSTGIRSLLMAYKQMKAKGGKLLMCGFRPEVFQVIEMVGLHTIFEILDTLPEALDIIRTANVKSDSITFASGDDSIFTYQPLDNLPSEAVVFRDDYASFGELGFSFGLGALAESGNENNKGLFFTLGKCVGFIPDNSNHEPDFRISIDENSVATWVGLGVSFGKSYAGVLSTKRASIVIFPKLAELIDELGVHIKEKSKLKACLIESKFEGAPAVSLCVQYEGLTDIENADELNNAISKNSASGLGQKWTGITFKLFENRKLEHGAQLINSLSKVLSLENISEVKLFDVNSVLLDATVWVLAPNGFVNAENKQLKIEYDSSIDIPKSTRFLIRRLYNDSSSVVLSPLHGGFSAQTFAVASFDSEGRKMRPTVLKTASKAMISREAESCQKHAMPYIFNNSAMVLGAVFFGDTGALRYNFVGIGGEQSKLKWLTHYYKEWSFEQLEPLFDKIFLQILNPWYGQPVKQAIYPFLEHDPTRTFFPHIFDEAEKVLGISANEPFITITETGEKLTNPYWFLKHEYPKHYKHKINFLTSICHGDLNMQNILLDEAMNVYLIDFSETKPRSIVSDFARLEAIFMVDFAPLDEGGNFKELVQLYRKFYSSENFDDALLLSELPAGSVLSKNMAMAIKMRQYAKQSSIGFDPVFAYYMALLEWILPIVCYYSSNDCKRLSMIVAATLCDELMKLSGGEFNADN